MSPLTPASAASLSVDELRVRVVDLIGEVESLRSENAALRVENEELKAANLLLRALSGQVESVDTVAQRPNALGIGYFYRCRMDVDDPISSENALIDNFLGFVTLAAIHLLLR